MSQAILQELTTSGRLVEFIGKAAQEALEPLCGVPVEVLGEAELPWAHPPVGIALVTVVDTSGTGFQAVVWLGGALEALASLAEVLLGERPDGEDEMLQDAVRELTNILAGQMQRHLASAGLQMGLGLPVYVGGARALNVGASLSSGAAVHVCVGLPDQPVLNVGFAAKES
ncbi:chemotaxis protein CheX [Thermomicrobium sp. 4228-Ro]|uniref:chemotaxis protein CheX n=1 Tax=Thermomicrobium sp. 4228-Ro TaxID=2993937 RepID=UPI0022493378|nr:chemotaxis protein CheX [Thermomicrobium sp. 4228-Ro]MCX2728213.1 chemotaxis protein CheX [Thermomicrobium sp. 4228-Ro]